MPSHIPFRIVAASIVVAAAWPCASPYRDGLLSPPNATFPGIDDYLPPQGTTDDAVTVVSVHGMCTHDVEWVKASSDRLARALGLHNVDPVKIDEFDAAELWKTELRGAGGRLTLTSCGIVCSPITQPRKAELCYDASEPSKSCPSPLYGLRRAAINSEFKSGLLNDCLSDVIIYFGGATSNRIRAAIARLIERVEADRNAGAPLFLITESLGSKILADTLEQDARSRPLGTSPPLADTRQISWRPISRAARSRQRPARRRRSALVGRPIAPRDRDAPRAIRRADRRRRRSAHADRFQRPE
jgi:hypothetical protein